MQQRCDVKKKAVTLKKKANTTNSGWVSEWAWVPIYQETWLQISASNAKATILIEHRDLDVVQYMHIYPYRTGSFDANEGGSQSMPIVLPIVVRQNQRPWWNYCAKIYNTMVEIRIITLLSIALQHVLRGHVPPTDLVKSIISEVRTSDPYGHVPLVQCH
jgi:hypothetical protein